MQASQLFHLEEDHPFYSLFPLEEEPWRWIPRIKKVLENLEPRLPNHIPPGLHIEGPVRFEEGVTLPPYGSITGPAWIGSHTELRAGVYIRGNLITGSHCVLGNSCEYKNSLLLDYVQTPHFNYVGDSILGNHSHLGAGAILSNLRFDQREIPIRTHRGTFSTGLRKLGAILGDYAEAGCNVVLQPGTILDRKSAVAPGLAYGGYLETDQIVFWKPSFHKISRRNLERSRE